jgi:hypothetical protein
MFGRFDFVHHRDGVIFERDGATFFIRQQIIVTKAECACALARNEQRRFS